MKRIIISLSLVSLFACGEEQPVAEISEPVVVEVPQSGVLINKQDNNTASEDNDWDDAKRSSQQALQDIWDASKESTQELVEDGTEVSQDIWDSSKEKSSELWEKGKENSKEIWQEFESGSKEAWSDGKEKVDQLLEKDEDLTINNDEI